MRLWSINPAFLDNIALRACWANAVLARNTIRAPSAAYAKHSPLLRFNHGDGMRAILLYMSIIRRVCRNKCVHYNREDHFCDNELQQMVDADADQINPEDVIQVSHMQLKYEYALLQSRLYWRNRRQYCRNKKNLHRAGFWFQNELFEMYEGDIEPWERPIEAIVKKLPR